MRLSELIATMRENDGRYDFVYGVGGTMCTLDWIEAHAAELGLADADGYEYDDEEGCGLLGGREVISNFGNIYDFICDHVTEEFAHRDEDDIVAFASTIRGFEVGEEDVAIIEQMLEDLQGIG
ncbi:MAG: hypothetical protein MJ061_07100 [Mailhella sp.]|nr:hypothetical protein [Mailhella sp.]